MARFSCSCTYFVLLLVVGATGQNQVPPGLRRPPFIVVPPAQEDTAVSSSNRRDLSATGPEVVLRLDEQIMVPEQRPPPPPPPPINPLPAPNQPPFQPNVPEPPPNQPLPPVVQLFPDNMPRVPDNQPMQPDQNQPGHRPIANRPNLPPIDRQCFQCLCTAASNCDQELKCVQPSPNQYFCGQYHISWAYWADSGKPGDRSDFPGAWEDCLLDNTCAERSIQSYMNKFADDCNNDGRVDCADFARVHKAGPPPSCNATWVEGTEYWHRFVGCWGGGLDLRSNGRK